MLIEKRPQSGRGCLNRCLEVAVDKRFSSQPGFLMIREKPERVDERVSRDGTYRGMQIYGVGGSLWLGP